MGKAVREASIENFEAMFRGLISSRPENLAYILTALHNAMVHGDVFDETCIAVADSELAEIRVAHGSVCHP